MPARRRRAPRRSASPRSMKPGGSSWPGSPPRQAEARERRVRPDDLLDLFAIDATATDLPPTARHEPAAGAAYGSSSSADPARLDPARAVAEPATRPTTRRRVSPFGLIGSLGLHLLPFLLLITWSSNPAEPPPPIPVHLVIERPLPTEPKPPPPPAEKKPPPGRLASVDMGDPSAKAEPAPAAPPAVDPAERQAAATPPPNLAPPPTPPEPAPPPAVTPRPIPPPP